MEVGRRLEAGVRVARAGLQGIGAGTAGSSGREICASSESGTASRAQVSKSSRQTDSSSGVVACPLPSQAARGPRSRLMHTASASLLVRENTDGSGIVRMPMRRSVSEAAGPLSMPMRHERWCAEPRTAFSSAPATTPPTRGSIAECADVGRLCAAAPARDLPACVNPAPSSAGVCRLMPIDSANCVWDRRTKRRRAAMSLPDSNCPRTSRRRRRAGMALARSSSVNSGISSLG